jgi:hypothetical protein
VRRSHRCLDFSRASEVQGLLINPDDMILGGAEDCGRYPAFGRTFVDPTEGLSKDRKAERGDLLKIDKASREPVGGSSDPSCRRLPQARRDHIIRPRKPIKGPGRPCCKAVLEGECPYMPVRICNRERPQECPKRYCSRYCLFPNI